MNAETAGPDLVVPARYRVRVEHTRRDPIQYSLSQRGWAWLVDLDDLPRLPGPLSRLVRFDGIDHELTPDVPSSLSLRENLDRFLAGHGVTPPARVLMLANPRVLGYVFNPLTVFYCYDETGQRTVTVAEVRNTYGGRHTYLLETDAIGRADTEKAFYVSPFYPVDGRYTMRLPEPGVDVTTAVTLHRDGDRPFSAVLTGTRTGDRPARLSAALRTPLATRAVMAGIKRHGITLYLKGLRPYPRPRTELSVPTGEPAPTTNHPPVSGQGTTAMTMTEHRPTAIDATIWPDIVRVPSSRLRSAVAERLVHRAVRKLPLRVTTADGDRFGAGTTSDPGLHLIRPDDFYARLGSGGLIGFGESYMAGDWDSDDLAGVLTVMASRMATLIPPSLQRLRSAAVKARPSHDDNTVANAKQHIQHHYDLSNDLFSLFLDESMTYSSAYFDSDPDRNDTSLTTAQHNKIDRLLDTAGVTAGTRLLEIGTGWGELAIRAAERGAQVTSVTISVEQAELAAKRIALAGYAEQVEVRLQDYRDVEGQFDAIVSVEMIEAVGANHWQEYFETLRDRLVPGGRVGLQAITMPHERMLASRDTYTWIVKYIFPGGVLPSVRSVRENADQVGLRMNSEFTFGLHYAETLRRWRERFESRADEVDQLGFDEVFRRMWSLYLAYSEAGFQSRYLDVVQFGMVKPAQPRPGVERPAR